MALTTATGSRRLPAAAAVLALVGAVAGCYSPTILDGTLACAGGNRLSAGVRLPRAGQAVLPHARRRSRREGRRRRRSRPGPRTCATRRRKCTPDARDAAVDERAGRDVADAAVESAPAWTRATPLSKARRRWTRTTPRSKARRWTRTTPPIESATDGRARRRRRNPDRTQEQRIAVRAIVRVRIGVLRRRRLLQHRLHGAMQGVRHRHVARNLHAGHVGSAARHARRLRGQRTPARRLVHAASPTACTYPGDETTCRSASCAGATFTARGGCNGAGACSNRRHDVVRRFRLQRGRDRVPDDVHVGQPVRHDGAPLLRRRRVRQRPRERCPLPDRGRVREPALRRRLLLQRRLPGPVPGV